MTDMMDIMDLGDLNDLVEQAWEKYILGGIPVPDHVEGVRPIILDSWRRSQRYGVDPHHPKFYSMPDERLKRVLQENELLVEVAYPYLMNLYEFIQGTNYQILLADKHGCVLKCITGTSFADNDINALSMQANVEEGIVSNETTNGTNGVSLCLAAKKPVEICGAEHYNKAYHSFACCGAPLHGPDNSVIGCISMMGPAELHQSHTLGMLCSAASGIEREFQLTRTNHMLENTMNAFSQGLIILDRNLNVLHYNHSSASILGLPADGVTGRNIFELIDRSSLPPALHEFHVEVESLECTLTNMNGNSSNISLTVKHSTTNMAELNTIMLSFTTQRSLHHLANQVVGFSAYYTLDSIIGNSRQIAEIKHFCKEVASTPSTVLIQGESGTGKELLAQAIHNSGMRAGGPFVAINCGSLPAELIESELFGYESGAFTGASKAGNPGKFELANGGTLFLDEIGDMPLELQKSLLRVLSTHQVTRLGGKTSKNIDVKIVAATNVDLLKAVEEKSFREDLYYRLNVLSIEVPPLRERKDDILPLLQYSVRRYSDMLGRDIEGFDDESLSLLMSYNWPGNVRELENVVERAVNFAQGNVLTLRDLPSNIRNYAARSYAASPDAVSPSSASSSADKERAIQGADISASPESSEYLRICRALENEHGHAKTAAADLNIPLSTFYRKLEKYNIDLHDFRKW